MKKQILIMAVILGSMFGFTTFSQAETSQFLTASNVRSYNFATNTGLVIQVGGQTVDSLCNYPDHLQISVGDPGYDTAVKLFLSQWTKDENVQFQVYYTPGECTQGYGVGNVKIQGFFFQ